MHFFGILNANLYNTVNKMPFMTENISAADTVKETGMTVASVVNGEQGSVWSSVLVLAGCILIIVLLIIMWSQYMRAQKHPERRLKKRDERAFDSNGIVNESSGKKNISKFAGISRKEK